MINRARSRTSVSAENFEIDENFVPPVIPKDEATRAMLFGFLNRIFMFQFLEKGEKNVIINALKSTEVKDQEHIIKQGDPGHQLFVVTKGSLE